MNSVKRILVVDDEEQDRSLLEAMLDSFGYSAELTGDGAEALQKLGSYIDLVLLDVLMPGLDGLEVARRIRNRTDCGDIPIIMVTALTAKEDRLQAIAAGANDFISKPIDRTELQVRLASLLKMKDAQEALRQSEKKYRTLVETAQDVVWTLDLDLRYTYVSPSISTALGYTVDEAISMHPLDNLTQESKERIVKAFNEELALEAAGPRDRHACRVEEIERCHKDGSTRWAEISASFLRDDTGKPIGIMGVSHDITERKRMEVALEQARDELEQRVEERTAELSRANEQLMQEIADRKTAEEALRESEQRFRTLVERAPLAIAFSRDLKFVYVNPEFLKMLGFADSAELVGQPITDRIAPEDLIEFTERARGRENGLPAQTRYEATAVRKDGSRFPFEAFVTRLSLSDGDVSAVFLLDITERKQAEKEREALRTQIFQAQKMDALGTLTGGIAHDFNNLLSIMNGYTELILSEKTEDDPIYSDLQKVLETGQRGAELVQRLLAFGKKAEIDPQPININLTVENSIKLVERTFPRMIEIQTRLAKDLRTVNADAVQVEQVLMNLCINAKEAMPEGGRLRIETRNIFVDEQYCRLFPDATPGRHVLIEVSDTGAGMSEETVKRMFDPFFTTKGWNSKKGTGLGLSVSRGIVEQHGGWITCESEEGKGTVFRVYLPAMEALPEEESPHPEPASVTGDNKILVVDDEAYVRDLGKRILERSGYTVITAADGKEAVEIYAREKSNIALVVLDLIMPHMAGWKCLEELLSIDPQVKVIVSTGRSVDPSERADFEAYVKGFVNKPYQIKHLLEVVRQVMDATTPA